MDEAIDPADALHSRLEGCRFVMLTTVSEDGTLDSRPMTVQALEGWTLRFIAQEDNEVVTLSEGKSVGIAVMDGGNYLSLSGLGSVSRSVQEKQELWNRLNEAYAGDADDPDNVILDVTVESGAYWDAGNPVARIIGLAKAAITGEAPDGRHGAVEL